MVSSRPGSPGPKISTTSWYGMASPELTYSQVRCPSYGNDSHRIGPPCGTPPPTQPANASAITIRPPPVATNQLGGPAHSAEVVNATSNGSSPKSSATGSTTQSAGSTRHTAP